MGFSAEKIESWLREQLERGASLPPVRELCRQSGVSSRDVATAVARLRAGGLLNPRRGIGLQARDAALPERRRTWNDLAASLEQELHEGRFPSNTPLPAPKELAGRWGVHPVTVRSALARLTRDGLLERHGRLWAPSRPVVRAGTWPVILCVGGGDAQGRLLMEGDRESDGWRELQAEASAQRLAVRPLAWSSGELGRLPDGTMGAVVSTWHVSDPQELLGRLAARRVRICVWTESALDRTGAPGHDDLVSVHGIGSSREAGRAMGEHLRELGHRTCAWISPFHASRWSKERLEGLQEGFAGRVDACTLDLFSEWEVLEPFVPELVDWERRLEGLDLSWSLAPWNPYREIHASLGWAELARRLEPQWQRALASGTSVWVGASDVVAALSRRWLARQGRVVPGSISLCGFDDTALAMREDLTSYRFDAAALARSVVRHLLAPGPGGGMRRSHPGRLVVRGSTARA